MHAIEFHAVVENGSITIPAELKGQINGPVRVIVLAEDNKKRIDAADAIGKLLANPIKLEEFTPLTRDQIYDRG